jgi:hypothetical protein
MYPNNHSTALLQSDIVGLPDYETVQVFVNAILSAASSDRAKLDSAGQKTYRPAPRLVAIAQW